MVDRNDWIDWDNSMKTHIDQIEVKWKNDTIRAMEQQQQINKTAAAFDETVIIAFEELYKQSEQNRKGMYYAAILGIINLVIGFVAIMEAIR